MSSNNYSCYLKKKEAISSPSDYTLQEINITNYSELLCSIQQFSLNLGKVGLFRLFGIVDIEMKTGNKERSMDSA